MAVVSAQAREDILAGLEEGLAAEVWDLDCVMLREVLDSAHLLGGKDLEHEAEPDTVGLVGLTCPRLLVDESEWPGLTDAKARCKDVLEQRHEAEARLRKADTHVASWDTKKRRLTGFDVLRHDKGKKALLELEWALEWARELGLNQAAHKLRSGTIFVDEDGRLAKNEGAVNKKTGTILKPNAELSLGGEYMDSAEVRLQRAAQKREKWLQQSTKEAEYAFEHHKLTEPPALLKFGDDLWGMQKVPKFDKTSVAVVDGLMMPGARIVTEMVRIHNAVFKTRSNAGPRRQPCARPEFSRSSPRPSQIWQLQNGVKVIGAVNQGACEMSKLSDVRGLPAFRVVLPDPDTGKETVYCQVDSLDGLRIPDTEDGPLRPWAEPGCGGTPTERRFKSLNRLAQPAPLTKLLANAAAWLQYLRIAQEYKGDMKVELLDRKGVLPLLKVVPGGRTSAPWVRTTIQLVSKSGGLFSRKSTKSSRSVTMQEMLMRKKCSTPKGRKGIQSDARASIRKIGSEKAAIEKAIKKKRNEKKKFEKKEKKGDASAGSAAKRAGAQMMVLEGDLKAAIARNELPLKELNQLRSKGFKDEYLSESVPNSQSPGPARSPADQEIDTSHHPAAGGSASGRTWASRSTPRPRGRRASSWGWARRTSCRRRRRRRRRAPSGQRSSSSSCRSARRRSASRARMASSGRATRRTRRG